MHFEITELMSELLAGVIVVCVPIVTRYVVEYLKATSKATAEKVNNQTIGRYIQEIGNAVCSAVSATSQTYVDQLKSSGSFTKEEQEKAFRMSMETCKATLAPEIINWINDTYGDISKYLSSRIESEVRDQKIWKPVSENK